ncbi:ribonuclease III [Govanella unica]|uniref:Ribonuclease 3 n=1 Tax=Govanella unica TaxID=2975056 RepID=A0A9X3Z7P3_9PROT|nr:ribonuclease III [Govania unica]MDA5194268.1 ribonuclease III [Govania unica]
MSSLDDLDGLYSILGHRFEDLSLLTEALTHPSMAGGVNYQRLEFLGDRVLGLIIADLLYTRSPTVKEGVLARQLADLVRQEALAEVAQTIGLVPYIRLAKSAEDDGGRSKPAILADACEAVIGALYLDSGLEAAGNFIERAWASLLNDRTRGMRDAKSALQEWAQGKGYPTPSYRETAREGPDHAPSFTVEVEVRGHPPVAGSGPSKRAAEMLAADILLKKVQTEKGTE